MSQVGESDGMVQTGPTKSRVSIFLTACGQKLRFAFCSLVGVVLSFLRLPLWPICAAGLGVGFVCGFSQAEVTVTLLTAFIAIMTPLLGTGVFLLKGVDKSDVPNLIRDTSRFAGSFILCVAFGVTGGVYAKNHNTFGRSIIDIKAEYEAAGLWTAATQKEVVQEALKKDIEQGSATFRSDVVAETSVDEGGNIVCAAISGKSEPTKIPADELRAILIGNPNTVLRSYVGGRMTEAAPEEVASFVNSLNCPP
tara:strand:+ start:2537 stop:3292 length:756 start_codon:yes stop_codon:yes gene_type:complete